MFLSFQRLQEISRRKSGGATGLATGTATGGTNPNAEDNNSQCSMITPMTDASPTNVADLFDIPIDADEDLAIEEENANEENSNTIEDESRFPSSDHESDKDSNSCTTKIAGRPSQIPCCRP